MKVTALLPRPSSLATTGVGSLPHTQQELALQMALAVDIPYLPQLPRHSAAEYMIPQALDGLPGLRYEADGTATVNASVWARDGAAFNRRLDEALSGAAPSRRRSQNLSPGLGLDPAPINSTGDVAAFGPSPLSQSAWQPFLWEIEHRGFLFAKAQLAGPTTLRWLVTLDDGRRVSAEPSLERAIYRLVLARATAMARKMRERGATPILSFDEPGLYALDVNDPQHLVYLQELRLAAGALRQAGALAALHCCSNSAWGSLLGLGFDYLSLDVRLSLGSLLRARTELAAFAKNGGRLMLGIVPTNAAEPYDLEDLVATTAASLDGLGLPLDECLLSPACGLAMRTLPETSAIFEDLRAAQRSLRALSAA